MQIIRECRMRAVILTELAKDAPEFENQLLYVAENWLTLAILSEQLNAGTDGRPPSHLHATRPPQWRPMQVCDQKGAIDYVAIRLVSRQGLRM